jgi:hypothetical protein
VLLAAAAVNLQALKDYFHGDDYIAFIDLTTKPPLKHMADVITFRDADIYWRPLGELYYLILYKAFGLSVAAFHLGNIVIFLATIVVLYHLCLRAGFSRPIAVGACAIFGLYPNHAVSVSWITNGPRLIAVLFVLLGLLSIQKAIAAGRFRYELLAFLAFVLAAFADEVALSLAPLAVLYGLTVEFGKPHWLRRTVGRLAAYGALVGVLLPVQFIFGTGSDPGFNAISFGLHMPTHLWALTSKLVLPLRDGVGFSMIPDASWAAGAIAGSLSLAVLLFGSARLRFLVIWVLLALAPFTIWKTPIAPARYVYMAAVPFAILASWAIVGSAERLMATRPWQRLVQPRLVLRLGAGAVAAVTIALLAGVFSSMTINRNAAFARDSETYRILADGLPQALPTVPKNSRVVIYYGIWTGLQIWPDAVVRTVYHDPTLSVLNVPRAQVEAGFTRRSPRDLIVYYTGNGFIAAAPLRQAKSN